jgi:hypothetical protein
VALVAPAIMSFLTTLGLIEGVFISADMTLNHIARNYTDAQLGDKHFVIQAFRMGDAAEQWRKVAQSTNEYTTDSLVEYDCSRKFGQLIAA